MKKSLTKNSIFYLIYNVLNVIFPLVTGIYVAHVLLPNSIGQVETARNIAQYFVILSFLGIPTYGLREISKARNDKKELSKVYSELVTINSISTTVFLFIYLVVIFSVPSYRDNLSLFLITGGSIALNFLNNSWLYEGLEEFKYISIRNLIFKIVSFILLVLLVRDENDYIWYAAITVVGTAGNYILNVISAHKFVRLSFKGMELRRHLKPVFFLVVVNLAIEIYSLVDMTMLGIFCEDENVAFYSYGQKIYKILLQIINTFTMVLVPRIALLYKENRFEEFNQLLTKTLKVIILLTIPMIIGIWFVSDYLICAVYGDIYINASYVLKVLSFILLISPIGYLLGSRIMLVSGHESKMVIPVGIGAIINIIANMILINILQETGAAIASVISEICVMVIYVQLGRKYFKLHFESILKTLWKEAVAIILMSLILIGCKYIPVSVMVQTILQIVLAVFIYFIVLFLLKEDVVHGYVSKLMRRVFKNGK